MTDNEIIKAFESLYRKLLNVKYDLKITQKEFLALNRVDTLIKRQKAEIEQLTEEVDALNGNTEKYIVECERRSREIAECYTMSCYDCIHCDRCSDFESGFSAHCADVSKCKHFRNKADFAEVVRCKDCVHSKESPMRIICQRYGRDVNEDGYCNYGERKEE